MNDVILAGYLKDITHSHTINSIQFCKANLIVPRGNDDDIITLCFKDRTNPYNEGDYIELYGNLRSFSRRLDDNKNKVEIYVFTYFDIPNTESEITNSVVLDGRICKKDILRNHANGIPSLSFTIANNIFPGNGGGKINNYIPIVCWGENAEKVSEMNIGDFLSLSGKIHSRTYKKYDADVMEIKTAHEVVMERFIE